jgi:hypothetical protein
MARMSDRLPLFPFEYFDPIRKRWVQARYRALFDAIADRGQPFRITGPGWSPSAGGSGTAGHLARGPGTNSGTNSGKPEGA